MVKSLAFARLTASNYSAVFLVLILAGCGGGDGQPLSGKVTFDGKPVPAGKLYFAPDASKGNEGATGWATIVDGTFDTRTAGGRGVTPGALVVTIEGQDPNAKPPGAGEDVQMGLLFAGYQANVEVSKGQDSIDFEVPASAAGVPKSQPETASHIGP